MAKPLTVTPEMKTSLLQEFVQYLNSGKLSDGCVNFVRHYHYKNGESGKVRLHFEPKAYMKMTALIDGFTVDEVAWYGTVEHPEPDLFVVTDVYTYPQTVGTAAVNTDQEQQGSEYTKWMNEIEPEIWNKQRFQGHSHVKMPVTPSTTDLTHQRDLVSQFTNPDDFYIFMIWNQRLEYDAKIYDMATNTLYETKDIVLTVCDPELDLDAFMAEAKKMIKIQTYSGYGGYGYNYNGRTYGAGGKQQTGSPNYDAAFDDDDDFMVGNHAGAQSGGWQRGVYGDGKKQLAAAADAAKKGGDAEKKEESAASKKASGAGNVVDFGKVIS